MEDVLEIFEEAQLLWHGHIPYLQEGMSIRSYGNTPEGGREAMRRYRSKPDVRERIRLQRREYNARPEVKARKAAYMKEYRCRAPA